MSEPKTTSPSQVPNTVKHAKALRVWHWANGLLIIALLITVLINSTILKPRKNAPLVQAEMQKSGVALTPQQAQTAVHALSDKVWDFHVYLGYFLAAFMLYRLVAEIFQPANRKFIKQIKAAWLLFKTPNAADGLHDIMVKVVYLVFYLLLVIMVITGLSLAFADNLGLAKSLEHNIKDVHGFCMYLVLGFVIVHIIGVVAAELRNEKGIVSDMINGGEE